MVTRKCGRSASPHPPSLPGKYDAVERKRTRDDDDVQREDSGRDLRTMMKPPPDQECKSEVDPTATSTASTHNVTVTTSLEPTKNEEIVAATSVPIDWDSIVDSISHSGSDKQQDSPRVKFVHIPLHKKSSKSVIEDPEPKVWKGWKKLRTMKRSSDSCERNPDRSSRTVTDQPWRWQWAWTYTILMLLQLIVFAVLNIRGLCICRRTILPAYFMAVANLLAALKRISEIVGMLKNEQPHIASFISLTFDSIFFAIKLLMIGLDIQWFVHVKRLIKADCGDLFFYASYVWMFGWAGLIVIIYLVVFCIVLYKKIRKRRGVARYLLIYRSLI